ncbi:MAG: arsenate reductase (glutaredoxin) [Myxococcota bacterium]
MKEIALPLPGSDDEILLLHNPKCSKSRATLALLEERGARFSTRLYLEDPLDRGELRELARRLGRPALGFTRTGQAEFEQAGLSTASGEDALLDAMAATPILMERPIVIRGERAAIGRPPEAVLALLADGDA